MSAEISSFTTLRANTAVSPAQGRSPRVLRREAPARPGRPAHAQLSVCVAVPPTTSSSWGSSHPPEHPFQGPAQGPELRPSAPGSPPAAPYTSSPPCSVCTPGEELRGRDSVWFLLCTPPHQPSTEPGSRQPQHRTPWTQAGRDGTVHAPPHAHARTLRGQATSPPRETSRPHLLHLLNSGPERPAGPTERSASEVSEPCLTSAQWPHPLHREQPGLFLYYF